MKLFLFAPDKDRNERHAAPTICPIYQPQPDSITRTPTRTLRNPIYGSGVENGSSKCHLPYGTRPMKRSSRQCTNRSPLPSLLATMNIPVSRFTSRFSQSDVARPSSSFLPIGIHCQHATGPSSHTAPEGESG